MAYPTWLLSFILDDIDRRVAGVKLLGTQVRTESLAGAIPSTRILNLFINLQQERIALVAAAATPGIVQFARDQKNNQTLDVVVEFTAMLVALDAVIAWISTNFPKDAGGFLLARSFSGTTIVDRMFPSAQTAGLRAQLDTLIATIG